MPSFDLTQNMSSSYMLLAFLEKGELEWIGKSQNTVRIYFRSNQLKQLKYEKKSSGKCTSKIRHKNIFRKIYLKDMRGENKFRDIC